MTTYNVTAGDTFELISRKVYGTEREAQRIARANPGTSEPLAVGTVLTIPPLPGAPTNSPSRAPSADPDEVAVLIDGVRFRFWEQMAIRRSIDSIDSISLGAPFDHSAPGFKTAFRPFAYKPLSVTVGGEPLFTGTLVSSPPSLGDRKTIAASGYAIPGVLQDCPLPASAYPIEYNGLDLRGIARAVADMFGLAVSFEVDAGPVFDRVSCTPDRKAWDFLSDLARQRNLVISNTATGALRFLRSTAPGSPVARLAQGEVPVVSVNPSFLEQNYYSEITGISMTTPGVPGAQYTVKNPHASGTARPFVFSVMDAKSGGLKAAVEAKAGRMIGNAVSYSVQVATWRDPGGDLWAPNTTVKLTAPDAMIYSEYEFLIRSVQLERRRAASVATLDLVLPGAFSGTMPEAMPWDE